MSDNDYGKRIQRAFLEFQAITGQRLTLGWLGEAVAKAEIPPRATAYTAAAVSGWVTGRNEPTLSVFQAIAAVLGIISPAFLAFGSEGMKAAVHVRGRSGRARIERLLSERERIPGRERQSIERLESRALPIDGVREAYAEILGLFLVDFMMSVSRRAGLQPEAEDIVRSQDGVAAILKGAATPLQVERATYELIELLEFFIFGGPPIRDAQHLKRTLANLPDLMKGLFLDRQKRQEASVWAPPLLAAPETELATPKADAVREDLEAAVKELPELLREVFMLHYIHGHSVEEIAKRTTVDVGTINDILKRAKAAVRVSLMKRGHDGADDVTRRPESHAVLTGKAD